MAAALTRDTKIKTYRDARVPRDWDSIHHTSKMVRMENYPERCDL